MRATFKERADHWVVSMLMQLVEYRKIVLIFGLFSVVAMGFGVTKVVRDPSVDAFVPLGHPAAVARDTANEIFGLEDPLVIGISTKDGSSVFTPAVIEALRILHDEIRLLPNVKKNDLISITTESAISSDNGDLLVDLIVEPGPVTKETAALAWQRVTSMPMMMDVLASTSGDMVTLIVPVVDTNKASDTYQAIFDRAHSVVPPEYDVSIAGVAAMNARLGQMVNGDTRIMVPVCVLVVLLSVIFALRNMRAVVGPALVILGATAFGVGALGWMDSRYYLITTALPLIIMAIAVADSLHMTSIFMRIRRTNPDYTAIEALRPMLLDTWLPVTLTSVTTIAGFAGLSLGAGMLPIVEFGNYASVGVAAAWAFSLLILPAVLVLTNLTPKPGSRLMDDDGEGGITRAIRAISNWSFTHPRRMVFALLLFIGVSGWLALHVQFDYERKRYFLADEDVRQSDIRLNDRLSGLNYLDIVVTAPQGSSLMTPEALSAMAELKSKMAALPHVNKVTGIDDYISLMHEILVGAEPGQLPTKARAPRQYMFLYEASGDPGDFEEEIDYDYQNALIRAQLHTDEYTLTKPIVDDLIEIAAAWSAQTGFKAAVSGRVAVNDGWMTALADSHFVALGLAVVFIFMAVLVSFRHVGYAALSMVPVFSGILLIYATMTFFGIDIAPATSMSAAIAAGLGVDFGIHLLSHVRNVRIAGGSLESALSGQYLAVGRACFYSAFSLILGLSVLALSSAPPLHWFGLLVGTAAAGSAFGALVIIPGVLAISQKIGLIGVPVAEGQS